MSRAGARLHEMTPKTATNLPQHRSPPPEPVALPSLQHVRRHCISFSVSLNANCEHADEVSDSINIRQRYYQLARGAERMIRRFTQRVEVLLKEMAG